MEGGGTSDQQNDDSQNGFKISTCKRIYIYLLDLFSCLNLCSKLGDREVSKIKRQIDFA